MQAFGSPATVNPFDRFGDHLRLALKAPASYQLLTWLESGPGAALPERGPPPRERALGRLRLRPARPRADRGPARRGPRGHRHRAAPDGRRRTRDLLVGDGSDPWVLAQADLDRAVGFVAGTDNDTTNLSLVAARAGGATRGCSSAARQNRAASAPLFAAMELDALLVPTEVVAHEVYAQLSTPLLWRFLREMPAQGDDWAAAHRSTGSPGCAATSCRRCGRCGSPRRRRRRSDRWLASGEARLGQLLRNPEDRDEPLHAVVLLVLRGREATLAPGRRLRPRRPATSCCWPAGRPRAGR